MFRRYVPQFSSTSYDHSSSLLLTMAFPFLLPRAKWLHPAVSPSRKTEVFRSFVALVSFWFRSILCFSLLICLSLLVSANVTSVRTLVYVFLSDVVLNYFLSPDSVCYIAPGRLIGASIDLLSEKMVVLRANTYRWNLSNEYIIASVSFSIWAYLVSIGVSTRLDYAIGCSKSFYLSSHSLTSSFAGS